MRGDQTPINKKYIVINHDPKAHADGDTFIDALNMFITMFIRFNMDVDNIIVNVYDLTNYSSALLDNDTLTVIGFKSYEDDFIMEIPEVVESFRIGDRKT